MLPLAELSLFNTFKTIQTKASKIRLPKVTSQNKTKTAPRHQ